MSKYKVGDDCMWDHCSSIATCPCCEKDMKIAELEDALRHMAAQTIFKYAADALAAREKDDG